jgi:glycosyltransferase involved in cell wall biosynthesis
MGRLVPEKRVDWLIRSYQELAATSHHPLPALVVAGGSSATDDHVRELHHVSRGEGRVVFTGYVAGEEKEELLSNALVFVLPSYLEGFPIVLLEAKSYGVCCLASDIAPHREALASGIDGLLFSRDDQTDLTRKLGALLAEPAAARALGITARAAVSKRPRWDEIVERTRGVYRDVLGR